MSISPDNSQADIRTNFLQYVTGRLPEPDKTRFEEQLLVDHDFSDAAATCEQELIDAYALQRLNPEETRAIRLWIEASPDRVERVAVARALLKTTPRRTLHRRQLGAALALAACLLIAATLYRVKSLHREQRVAQQSVATAATPQAQPPPIGVAAKPDVVLIAAERTRGERKTTNYQVHRESPIQLQILLPGMTARSGYQVRITPATDQNKILIEQNDLEAQSMTGQLYLAITLPPGSLPPATYTAFVSRQGDTLTSTFTLKWVLSSKAREWRSSRMGHPHFAPAGHNPNGKSILGLLDIELRKSISQLSRPRPMAAGASHLTRKPFGKKILI